MNEPFAASILIIEDDPRQIRLYSQALAGYRLTCVNNGAAALAAIAAQTPDLILLDNVLKNGEFGLDLLPRLKEAATHVPVIVISGTLDVRAQLAALSGPNSAHYAIEKPVDIADLEKTVAQALNECGFAETVAALRSLENAEKIETGDRERLFTERLARQLELLRRFRGATTKPNISQLAEKFRVDRKTIRRDLHDLITRGQLPGAALDPSEAE